MRPTLKRASFLGLFVIAATAGTLLADQAEWLEFHTRQAQAAAQSLRAHSRPAFVEWISHMEGSEARLWYYDKSTIKIEQVGAAPNLYKTVTVQAKLYAIGKPASGDDASFSLFVWSDNFGAGEPAWEKKSLDLAYTYVAMDAAGLSDVFFNLARRLQDKHNIHASVKVLALDVPAELLPVLEPARRTKRVIGNKAFDIDQDGQPVGQGAYIDGRPQAGMAGSIR